MEWFRTIKTLDGKPPNRFAYDDQVLSVEKTIEVIEDTHAQYVNLMEGSKDGVEELDLHKCF